MTLPDLWFCLLWGMLAVYVVLGGSDLGVGIVHLLAGRSDAERSEVIRTIQPVWKGHDVWLIAAGGTMLLGFPKALATAFSGFYLPLMLVLWLFAIRALGLELRSHVGNDLWRQFWDACFSIGSLLLAVCLGAALGNVVRGVPLEPTGVFFEPLWTDFRVGPQTGILDWYTVLVGVTAALALAHHGALWLLRFADGPRPQDAGVKDGEVQRRAGRLAGVLFSILVGAFVLTTIATFAAGSHVRESLDERPFGFILPALAAVALVVSHVKRRSARPGGAHAASGVFLAAMFATAGITIYPHILPGRDPALGLSIQDAAAPRGALVIGLAWWIPGILIACGYVVWTHRRMLRV